MRNGLKPLQEDSPYDTQEHMGREYSGVSCEMRNMKLWVGFS